jgi:hypothetical protein
MKNDDTDLILLLNRYYFNVNQQVRTKNHRAALDKYLDESNLYSYVFDMYIEYACHRSFLISKSGIESNCLFEIHF